MLINNKGPTYRYIEDARKAAFERVGHDAIKKVEGGYIVEALPDFDDQYWTQFASHIQDNLELSPEAMKQEDIKKSGIIDDLFGKDKKRREKLSEYGKKSKHQVLEFAWDNKHDGDKSSDERYTFNKEYKVSKSDIPYSHGSNLLKSPFDKGIKIFREAMAKGDPDRLIKLTPSYINAIFESDQLSEQERQDATFYLKNKQAESAIKLFSSFFSENASFASIGSQHFSEFVELLNDPFHRKNIEVIYEIAKHPANFQNSIAEDETQLVDLAKTLRKMPGFRRYPPTLKSDKQKGILYEDAIRTINQYSYKVKVTQGMQFNKKGITGHNTELSYRFNRGNILTLGVSGKDYDFGNFGQGGVEYGGGGDIRQRLSVAYSSPAFDIKVSAGKDKDGKVKFEQPESQAVDRYIGRKQGDVIDSVKNWAKKNPFWAGTIVAGAVGGVFVYSKMKPEDDLSVKLSTPIDIYKGEFVRVKASIAPEIKLKDGKPDLGLKEVGLGVSGNKENHYYDLNVRHKTEDTTIRAKAINHEESIINARYGIGRHSMTVDYSYKHKLAEHTSRVGYRKDFVFAPGFRAYGHAYVQTKNTTGFDTAGAVVGVHKELGKTRTFSMDVNLGYDYKNGMSGGFSVTKAFSK